MVSVSVLESEGPNGVSLVEAGLKLKPKVVCESESNEWWRGRMMQADKRSDEATGGAWHATSLSAWYVVRHASTIVKIFGFKANSHGNAETLVLSQAKLRESPAENVVMPGH